jgi:hypothetical protein
MIVVSRVGEEEKGEDHTMGTEEGEGCVMANSARGHRFSALLIVLAAMVVATVMVIVVALDTGTARAATPTRATIEATSFTVDYLQTGEAFAVCPGTKRALGGGVVQSGPPVDIGVMASGPLDATGLTIETNDFDKAKQWYAAVSSGFHESGTQIFKTFAICE